MSIDEQQQQPDHYKFDWRFQKQIVALTFRDPTFLASYHDILSPAYFQSRDLFRLMDMIVRHYDRYMQAPAHMPELINLYARKHKLEIVEVQKLLTLVDEMEKMDLSNQEFVRDRVVRFGRKQALKQAVAETIEILKDDDESEEEDSFDRARPLVEKALSVGRGTSSDGMFLHDIISMLPDKNARSAIAKRVSTGLKRVDYCLGGGPGSGELVLFVSPPAVGKSLVMDNMAAMNVFAKKRVALYTMELKSLDVMNRVVCRLTGFPIRDLQSPTADSRRRYEAHVADLMSRTGPEGLPLAVQYYSPKSATVGTIRSHLTHLRVRRDFKPDLIIVDYADKVLPTYRTGPRSEGNTYLEMGAVLEELIGLANDFECPVVTGSQLRREGVKKAKTRGQICDMDDLADSMRKAHDADVIITLNQSPEERMANRMRAFLAKVRRGEAGIVIDLNVDYSRMKVTECSEQRSHEEIFGHAYELPVNDDPSKTDLIAPEPEVQEVSDILEEVSSYTETFGTEIQDGGPTEVEPSLVQSRE